MGAQQSAGKAQGLQGGLDMLGMCCRSEPQQEQAGVRRGDQEQRKVFGTIKNVGEGRRDLPRELMCYLSDDAPPLKGRKAIALGMTLARMHYKERETAVKVMDSRQLAIVDTAVDMFYQDWEQTTQQQKNEMLYDQRCSNDEEDNILFLARKDMRADFKSTLEKVLLHSKAVKVNNGRPGKIKTETMEERRASWSPNAGAAAEVTEDFFTTSGSRRGSVPSNRVGSPVADDSVSPLQRMPPRSQSQQQLRRSSNSFKRTASTSVPVSPTGEEAVAPQEGILRRSSSSFKRSGSTAVPLTKTDSKSSLRRGVSLKQ